MKSSTLPVVIIGAGPVGLAAGAHAVARGLTPVILEAGSHVGFRRTAMGPRPNVLAVEIRC